MEEIREALLNIKSPQIRELLDIVQEAQHVLFEISNTRDIGWPENTPTEKYRILMAHMADRAKEVYESLTERISRFRT